MAIKKLIGLSLSLCIKDIVTYGEIKPEMVEALITGTRMMNDYDLEHVIGTYENLYWSANPQAGADLARRFWREGRIHQPRTVGKHPFNISDGRYWRTWDDPELLDIVTEIVGRNPYDDDAA